MLNVNFVEKVFCSDFPIYKCQTQKSLYFLHLPRQNACSIMPYKQNCVHKKHSYTYSRNRTMSCDNTNQAEVCTFRCDFATHTSNQKSSVFASAFTHENSCAISHEKHLRRCEQGITHVTNICNLLKMAGIIQGKNCNTQKKKLVNVVKTKKNKFSGLTLSWWFEQG